MVVGAMMLVLRRMCVIVEGMAGGIEVVVGEVVEAIEALEAIGVIEVIEVVVCVSVIAEVCGLEAVFEGFEVSEVW